MKNFLFLDALKTLNTQGDHREERARSQGAKLHLPLASPLICLGLLQPPQAPETLTLCSLSHTPSSEGHFHQGGAVMARTGPRLTGRILGTLCSETSLDVIVDH